MAKHTGLINTTDTSIKKVAVKDNGGTGLLMVPDAPTFIIKRTQKGVFKTTDDIQTIELSSKATEGTWTLNVAEVALTGLSFAVDAATINSKLTTLGITNTIASNGPLGDSPITITTTQAFAPLVYITDDLLIAKPFKWLATLNEIVFSDVISSSLYTTVPAWTTQAIFMKGSPTSGTVSLNVNVNTPFVVGPLSPTATTADLQTLLDAIPGLKDNYDAYGGPWPNKALMVQFKNELQYQSQIRFTVGTNSLNNSGLPIIWPVGKQILVSYHEQLTQSIVVRPGYI